MTILLRLKAVAALILVATTASARSESLLCPELQLDETYAEGSMKAMSKVVVGKGSWLFRSDFDLANSFGMPEPYPAEFARLVERLNQQGIALVMAVQPTRGLMHKDKVRVDEPYGFDPVLARQNMQNYLIQLSQAGAVVPNVMTLVDEPPEEEYFFRRDHHWTPAGARETAKIVAELVRKQPWYEDLPQRSYVTETGLILPKDGTMNTALKYVCGNNFGIQYVQGYQTAPADLDGADALFGNTEVPQLILVGTSNSAVREDERKNYNFQGFLQDYIGAEILNYALQGSGQDGSLIQYLQSPDYDPDNPPKAIIWELPVSYALDDPLIYRQLIPAVDGACDKADAVLQQQASFSAMQPEQRYEVLSNTAGDWRDLRGQAGYLDLRVSDSSLKEFYVITYYDNGERDKVWFRRPAIVDGGQYYLELSRDPDLAGANILSVFIEPTQSIETQIDVEVALCTG
ncbi:alginate O-acetyltransferase AlgX-related protein [Gilvimarinus agarilyticus]|uniref:alginate O-acetyltransferase AlgX-related protein n=1 Tax=Gilvimarinus agarilyticus TaxID=679259 RepID=UPI0005A10879|nr:alginate biosynthesis protein AlgX [Gilvimarinus agarilyticus]